MTWIQFVPENSTVTESEFDTETETDKESVVDR